jgi:methionine-rich copper-binding protein CopC
MTLVKDRSRATVKPSARRKLRRRFAACGLLVLAVWVTMLSMAVPTSLPADQPVLRSSTPGVGSTIRPDSLVLTFDRPVDAGLATVRLTDPYERPLDPGRPAHVDGRPETLSVPLPRQKYAGTYAVAWFVPSGAHGTLTFDLASRSPAWPAPELPATPTVSATTGYMVAQFGTLIALALLTGAVFRVAVTGTRTTRVRRLVTIAWAGSVVGTFLTILTYGPYVARLSLTDVFDGSMLTGTLSSDAGATFLTRLLLLALTGAAVAQLMSTGPAGDTRERWLRGGTVVGCGAALLATWGFAGVVPFVVTSAERAQPQAAPARLAFDTGGQDGKGFLDLVVTPARLGTNRVDVTVLDDQDLVRDGIAVTAVLNPPDGGRSVPVRMTGGSQSTGAVRVPGPGEWELAVTVRSADGKQQTIYGVVEIPSR